MRIAAIEEIAPWVRRIALAPQSTGQVPAFDCGDCIDVQLAPGAWSPFSLTGSPDSRDRYEIVLRGKERSSPSSTHALFHDAAVGDALQVRHPQPGLPLASGPGPHIFIAGGVGLTAFVLHLKTLAQQAASLQLHYASRAPLRGLVERLGLDLGPALHRYVSERGQRLDPERILAGLPATAHIYVCGPIALLEPVIHTAITRQWPMRQVHWDRRVRLGDPGPALSLAA